MIDHPISIGEQNKEIRTSIDFHVRSPMLRLYEVNKLLGVEATWGFEAGAPYLGRVKEGDAIRPIERKRPSFGVWHFDTSFFIRAEALEEHALFLLKKFEHSIDQIQQLIANPDYEVAMSLWHVGPTGFDLSSSIIARLAVISEWMGFTCWETNEDSCPSQEFDPSK